MLFHDKQQVLTIKMMTLIIPLFLGGMYWRIDHTQARMAAAMPATPTWL
jgi:hypothetical protein